MSHITVIKTQIRDLAALEEALRTAFAGASLVRGATSFQSYNRREACSHKIKVEGVNYEMGLVPDQKTSGAYNIAKDFYGRAGTAHDGHKLEHQFGPGCRRLVQEYAATKATRELRARGCIGIKRTTKRDGTIVVRAQLA